MIKEGVMTGRKSSLYLSGVTQRGEGSFLFFDAQTGAVTLSSSARGLYVNSSDQLVYWSGLTSTILGSSGSIVSFGLDDAYDDGNSITVDGAAVTFAGSHATNDVVSITGSAAVTGDLLALTNSGSGADISANSAWSITTSGGVAVIELSSGATINAVDGALTIGKTGTATTFSGTVTVDEAVTLTGAVTATASLTITGSADSNVLTVTAGDILVSNGKLALTNDDTDSAVAVTAASVTTGNVVSVTANGITTGSMLYLAMTEAGITANDGAYIECYDSTAGAVQFTVQNDGKTTITGNAVGTQALTLTAGDLALSDGNVSITSSSTADVFVITADSLLANNALIVKGSGTFTGTTTSSFVAITPTGLSTGTALYIAGAAATTLSTLVDFTTSTTTGIALRLTNTGILTGVGAALSIVADAATTAGASAGEGVVNISVDGLTTGAALNIESISNELLTSGVLAHFDHSAVGTTIAAKTGSLVSITSSMTESGTSSQDFDMLSIVRTSVHDTAGTLTATGSLLYLENVATESGATLTDTVNGLEVVMDAQGTGTGVKVTHPGVSGKSLDVIASTTTGTVALLTMNSLTTTGVGLSLTNTGTGMTSGSVFRVASGTTSAVATNGVVSLFATGAFTSTAVTDGFVRVNANSTLSGTAVAINGNSFTTGVGLYVGDTGTGMTSGSLIRAVSASTGAVASNGILSVQATGDYTSTANMGILSAIANTTTAGTVAYISATSMVGGTLLFLNATAATLTGKYIQCYDGAADDFSVGQYGATVIAGNATGTAALTLTNGNILLSSGNVTLTAGTIIETAQAILNANTAISVTHGVTKIANNAPSTHTFANGVEGQKKTIVCTVYTGDAVITPDNLANGATITLNAVNDAVDLVFLGSEWFVVNLYGTAAVGA